MWTNKMRRKGNKSSSSSTESSSNNHSSTVSSASSSHHSRLMRRNQQQFISTDLQLGLGSAYACPPCEGLVQNDEYERMAPKLFVKVYMEGISIGRKLDLLALDGYHDLINTLEFMFRTTIIWAEGEEIHPENSHVLTYEDKEGDWMIVGDVPWEAFLSTVKRLKITRIE
ncbi:hypothetical protein LIER_19299 [Lithospermum erythrorhizon]|uniref:Auxin-responsive protein n=1 Tax=Lithospermum erythrorhizon TaxID=34254 RepID=A0AAV3QK70_LITER